MPEAWCVLHGFIPTVKTIDELLECGDARFFEAVHSAEVFEVDMPVRFDVDTSCAIMVWSRQMCW